MEKFSSYLADHVRPVIDKKYRTRSDAADDLGIDQAVLSRICSGNGSGLVNILWKIFVYVWDWIRQKGFCVFFFQRTQRLNIIFSD